MINGPAIALLLIGLAGAGGFWFGLDWKEKQYAERENIRLIAWNEALDKAAERVGSIKSVNQTIYKNAETVIKEKHVLTECKNPPEMIEAINAAAKGGAK